MRSATPQLAFAQLQLGRQEHDTERPSTCPRHQERHDARQRRVVGTGLGAGERRCLTLALVLALNPHPNFTLSEPSPQPLPCWGRALTTCSSLGTMPASTAALEAPTAPPSASACGQRAKPRPQGCSCM